jgi:hypothetical protein
MLIPQPKASVQVTKKNNEKQILKSFFYKLMLRKKAL